jgi:hypothetical protein
MPYQGYADGIYLAAQPSTKGVFTHFGTLDIGNCLQIEGADGIHPIIVDQSPPHIQASWLRETGTWQLLAVASDPTAARLRYLAALTSPHYYPLRHNCEHFARFVVTGTWESRQVQALGWIAGLVALAIAADTNGRPVRRSRRLTQSSHRRRSTKRFPDADFLTTQRIR